MQEDVLTNDLPNENYLQFEIVLNGDFNTIGRFVKSLENFEYYCDIVGLQIRNSTEVTSSKSSQGNPFNESGDSRDSQNKNGKLEATLDVVFYTE